MTDKQKAFLSILGGAIIGGATAAVTKIGLTQIPPLSFAFLRFFLALVILSPFYLTKKNLLKDIKLLTPISLLATLNIMFFVLGLKLTTATISQLLYTGSPIIIGFIAHFFYKGRLTPKQAFGIIMGFVGVSVVVLLPITEKGKEFSGDFLGNLFIAMGVILYSLYTLFSKKVQQVHSPMRITFVFILVTTIALFPFFVADLYNNSNWFVKMDITGVISVVYISVCATIFTYLLHQYAIKHGGAVFASMNLYLLPIFSFLAANFFLGEQLTMGIIIGGILALAGVFFVTSKD